MNVTFITREWTSGRRMEQIPRRDDMVFIHGKHYCVSEVLWKENECEVRLVRSAYTEILDDENKQCN